MQLSTLSRKKPNDISCASCYKFWSCKKDERKDGRGCLEFALKRDQDVQLDKPTTPKLIKPVKTKIYTSEYDEDRMPESGDATEDYSNYFTSTNDRLNLPEQDHPLAKNIYEFVFGRKFLNLGATGLYARQFGIALNFFTEYCPKCSDLAYIKRNFEVTDDIKTILERVQLLEHDKCPKCKTTKIDMIRDHILWDNWELAALCGQRSGKSLLAAIISSYTLHKFLKLKSIAETFEVAKPTIFLGTFVALDKSQIQDSTWGYLQNLIKDTPWFSNYCGMLKEHGRRIGRKLVDIDKVETIEFFCKNIKMNMAAPRPGALRGRTGFCGVIDEIGFLKTKDGDGRVVTADEVYASLNNRMGTLVTAFENNRLKGSVSIPTPIFLNISSPSHARDKICSLVRGIEEDAKTAEEDKKTLRRYAVTYPTWEVNPMFPRTSAYISGKFKTDPKEAERDFGAKPPLSENSFIEDVGTLKSNFTNKSNLIAVEYEIGQKHTNYNIKYLRDDFDRSIPRVLTLDLGFNNNCTAFSIGHFNESSNIMITDAFGEIIPINGVEVNFVLLVEKILKPLIEALNVKIVAADRWQSINMLQELEQKYKLKSITYSLKYSDFQFYKQALMNNRIQFPEPEDAKLLISCPSEEYPAAYHNKPVSHFFFQCLTVVDEKEKTVRKGDKTTDDLFRANVLLHYILNNLEYREAMKKTIQIMPTGPIVHVQSIRGTLGGSSSPKFTGTAVVVS